MGSYCSCLTRDTVAKPRVLEFAMFTIPKKTTPDSSPVSDTSRLIRRTTIANSKMGDITA